MVSEKFMLAVTVMVCAGSYKMFRELYSVSRKKFVYRKCSVLECFAGLRTTLVFLLAVNVYDWKVVDKEYICTSSAHEEKEEDKKMEALHKEIEPLFLHGVVLSPNTISMLIGSHIVWKPDECLYLRSVV